MTEADELKALIAEKAALDAESIAGEGRGDKYSVKTGLIFKGRGGCNYVNVEDVLRTWADYQKGVIK